MHIVSLAITRTNVCREFETHREAIFCQGAAKDLVGRDLFEAVSHVLDSYGREIEMMGAVKRKL